MYRYNKLKKYLKTVGIDLTLDLASNFIYEIKTIKKVIERESFFEYYNKLKEKAKKLKHRWVEQKLSDTQILELSEKLKDFIQDYNGQDNFLIVRGSREIECRHEWTVGSEQHMLHLYLIIWQNSFTWREQKEIKNIIELPKKELEVIEKYKKLKKYLETIDFNLENWLEGQYIYKTEKIHKIRKRESFFEFCKRQREGSSIWRICNGERKMILLDYELEKFFNNNYDPFEEEFIGNLQCGFDEYYWTWFRTSEVLEYFWIMAPHYGLINKHQQREVAKILNKKMKG
ncbi:hypothetical protein [Mesomycoplasma lagogenitalium]|uniref:Uncharacterized protein n=1 Tax=Mesomycoplasma lagogenitalium TaxID=171286 RepID=A0ABY8LT93_9BACT|nr:hypothetical protein [Mesomycoplasma lagogenitalium]WGI36458.1 hypothetical protein QEG99_03265 [Mesomycoplasma lagogenitalium]